MSLFEYTKTLVLARPSLTLVSGAFLDYKLVDIPLVPRLISTLGRCSPYTHRMNITLGFTTSTTVRMVCCVHGKTSNSGPDVEPSAPASLAELAEVPMWIARHTDSCTSIWRDPPDLSTL